MSSDAKCEVPDLTRPADNGPEAVARAAALFSLLRRIADHLHAVPGTGVEFTLMPLMGDAFTSYSRCLSLFHSIRLLLQHGQPEEAGILGRSLFEASLRLDYLYRQSERERESLLTRARMDALVNLERIVVEEAAHGGPGLSDEELAKLRERRTKLATRARERGVRPKAFPSDRDMAKQLGRLEQHAHYLYGHELTHGSLTAQAHRRRKLDADTVVVYSSNHSIHAAASIGLMAAGDVLVAAIAAGQMFGWPTDEAARLLGDVERVGEAIVEGVELD